MKQKFNTSWKASKQPRKQRKYLANAPLHLRKKFVSVSLSKELKKKYGKRNVPVKKGDKVKIMRGKFKKKTGKVLEVKLKTGKIYIEGMQVKKQEGSKVNVPFRASNLQIIEMNMEGRKRIKGFGGEVIKKEIKKVEAKKEESKVKKEETKSTEVNSAPKGEKKIETKSTETKVKETLKSVPPFTKSQRDDSGEPKKDITVEGIK